MRKIFISLIVGIFLIGIIGAATTEVNQYDDVKLGDCITLKQTCASCTYVNFSLSYPNSTLVFSDEVGTNTGGAMWTYEFCDTYNLGRYDVGGHGDLEGTDTGFNILWFEVTSTGEGASMFFLILLTSIAFIFFIASLFVAEEFFVYISGICFLIGGVYLMMNGLNVLNDTNTRYLAFIYLGIGMLFSIGAYIYNLYSNREEEEY